MTYTNIEENEDVTEVLFMVICGYGNVKLLRKYLDQPQATISMKLTLLRENKLVIKNKWNYEPNWRNITKLFRKLLVANTNERIAYKPGFYLKIHQTKDDKKFREGFNKNRRKEEKLFMKNMGNYFPDDFIENFLKSASIDYLTTGRGKESLDQLSGRVVEHLWLLKHSELKKINPKFAELKKGSAEFGTDISHVFAMVRDQSYKEWWVEQLSKRIKDSRNKAKRRS